MADKKISELVSLTGANAATGDLLPIVDISATETKKITRDEFFKNIPSIDINGGTIDGTVIGGSTPAAISGTTGQFGTSLNVDGTVTADGLTVDGAASIGSSTAKTKFYSDSTYSGIFNGASLGSNESFYMGAGGLFFYGGGSERMRIDSSGNVGIGTSSISALLHATGGSFGVGTGYQLMIGYLGGSVNYYDANTQIFRNGSAVEAMRIDSSGNVGVGTSSPATKLAVVGTGNTAVTIQDSSGVAYLDFTTGAGTQRILGGAGGTNSLLFYTGLAERMRIDASGNVGIGTSSPQSDLEIQSKTTGTDAVISLTAAGTRRYQIKALTSVGALAFVDESLASERMRIDSSGNVGIGKAPEAQSGFTILDIGSGSTSGLLDLRQNGARQARIYNSSTTVNIANNTTNGAIAFITADVGSGLGERMRIDSSGNVGIGTSSPTADLSVGSATSSSGDVHLRTSKTTFELTPSNSDAGGMDLNVGFVAGGQGPLKFSIGSSEKMRIDSSGNVLIGGTTAGTASAGNLVLFNGTAPTGNVTNGITLYAEDVSSSSELKVRDEAGNVTTLSPHNFDLIPEGPSEDMAWSYYSERDGKRINVDMLKAIRILEQLSGEKLVHMT